MPRPFPVEFRARAVGLVRAGKPITTTATELGISQSCLHNWVRQDQVNRGELPGVTTFESADDGAQRNSPVLLIEVPRVAGLG
jgi:transposase